jgi:RNA polymerase sigma factor (sigma-70 family)
VIAFAGTVERMSEGEGAAGFTALDEARLMSRVVAGDDSALGKLYDRYSGLVYGLARRVTRSTAVAEEITQEVFVFLWEHPERFDASRGSLRAFLGAVTHRRSVDVVRKETRRSAREDKVAVDPAVGLEIAEVIDLAERVAGRDLAERVRAAVATLPSEQREAVELAYFGGCTFKDVAVRLGIPEGTAKSRLRLALSKLAGLLEPEVVPT